MIRDGRLWWTVELQPVKYLTILKRLYFSSKASKLILKDSSFNLQAIFASGVIFVQYFIREFFFLNGSVCIYPSFITDILKYSMEKRGLTWLISVNHAVINITLGSTFLTQGFCRNKSWYSRSVSHSLMQSNKAWDLKGKIRNQSQFSCKQTYFIFIFIGSLSQRFWMTAMFFLKLIVGRINTSTDDLSFWVYLTCVDEQYFKI